MRFLHSGNVIRLPLDQIEVVGRLREVRNAFVENLILMAEDTGITTPIHVRKVKDGYVLIDGAHRLEAAKRMGLPDIAVLVVECRADEARAMEASNNLGAARMTPLQTAVFVASWKRDYYTLHPERKSGVFKGNQHTGKVVEEIVSLTTCIADAFSITDRQVRNILRAGESLTSEEAASLDAAPGRVTMKDLQDLAKIAEPAERSAVVHRLAAGGAKSAAAARKSLAQEASSAPAAAPADPNDKAVAAALTQLKRMSAVARRRFVAEAFAILSPLVVDEAEQRDAAEIAQISKGMAAG